MYRTVINISPLCAALRRQPGPQPGPQMIGKPTTNTVSGGADPFAGGTKIKPKFKGTGKLSKAAIGAPTEFRHLSHVGFDPTTGAFDVSVILLQAIFNQYLIRVRLLTEPLLCNYML